MKLLKRWIICYAIMATTYTAINVVMGLAVLPIVYSSIALATLIGVIISMVIESGRL